jgi:hypothetical protein
LCSELDTMILLLIGVTIEECVFRGNRVSCSSECGLG